MPEIGTPWRILEEPVEGAPSRPVATPSAAGVGRPALLMSVGVVVLVALAIALAFGVGASGAVLIEGG